jgi:hypothetical protein
VLWRAPFLLKCDFPIGFQDLLDLCIVDLLPGPEDNPCTILPKVDETFEGFRIFNRRVR